MAGAGHVGRTVLAVTVEPGSYKVGTAAAGANRWTHIFSLFSLVGFLCLLFWMTKLLCSNIFFAAFTGGGRPGRAGEGVGEQGSAATP